MARLFLMILGTIAFALFALANTERVGFSFVFGQTEVRLIFLLVTSFATGALAASFWQTAVALGRRRARRRRIRVTFKRPELQEADVE